MRSPRRGALTAALLALASAGCGARRRSPRRRLSRAGRPPAGSSSSSAWWTGRWTSSSSRGRRSGAPTDPPPRDGRPRALGPDGGASSSPRTGPAAADLGGPRGGGDAAAGARQWGDEYQADVSPDGKLLAFLSNLEGPSASSSRTSRAERCGSSCGTERGPSSATPLEPRRALHHLLVQLEDRPPDLRRGGGDGQGAPGLGLTGGGCEPRFSRTGGRSFTSAGATGGRRAGSWSTTSGRARSARSSRGPA